MGNGEARNERVTWQIALTPTARTMLLSIQDKRVRQKIIGRIEGLSRDPDKQGKALTSELSEFRSLRAVGQRYRIIYRLNGDQIIVTVVSVGIRKEGDKADVYKLTQKLLKLGLLKTE